MKIKKMLAILSAGVMTASFLSTAASAEDTAQTFAANENVRVLYDAPLNGVEFGTFELGKSIEGAKLRFTYVSDSEEGEGVVGIAGRAADDEWTWLQSESDPALVSEGFGVESVVEMEYEELSELADVGNNIRSYVFQDWGLDQDSNFKIELITPDVKETVTEVFNDNVDYNIKLSPFELGKAINGSKIRFTYTTNTYENWAAVGISGILKNSKNLIEGNSTLYSRGKGKEVVATFTYNDFVNYLGVGDNLEYVVFHDWRLKAGTNLKIELLTPVVSENTQVVFNGKISNTEISPYALGKGKDGAKIRISYTSAKPSEYKVLGVAGKGKDDLNWIWHKNSLCSKGTGMESVFTFSYHAFVEYMGIGDNLAYFVFQDWGLDANKNCKIELITPIKTEPVDPDPVPTENVEVIFDSTIPEAGAEFTPQQLGSGTAGAMLRFTYYSAEDVEADSGVIGLAGKANDADWTWLQNASNPALTTEGYGIKNVVTMSYDEFVALANIDNGENNVRCYVLCNWGLAADQNVKVELITPAVNYGTMTLFDGQLNDPELTPAELGKNIPGAKIQISFTADVAENWGAVGISGKAIDTWEWTSKSNALLSKGVDAEATYTFSYADFVAYAGIGDNLECFVFQNWGVADNTNVKIELLVPAATLEATTVTVTLFDDELTEEGMSLNGVALTPAQLGSLTPDSVIKVTYTGAYEEDCIAIGLCGNGVEWYTGVNHLASIGEGEENTYITTYAEFVEFVGITAPINTYVFQNWGLQECSTTTIELIIPTANAEVNS